MLTTTQQTSTAFAGGAQNTAHNAENHPTPMTPDEWDIAACRYHPKELFFPTATTTGKHGTKPAASAQDAQSNNPVRKTGNMKCSACGAGSHQQNEDTEDRAQRHR